MVQRKATPRRRRKAKAAPASSKPRPGELSARAFALLLGPVTLRTLFNLRDAGMPARLATNGRDWWYGAESLAWYIARKQAEVKAATPADDTPERRRMVADMQWAELRVREKMGELVPAGEARQDFRAYQQRVRGVLLATKNRHRGLLAGVVPPEQAGVLLERVVQAQLEDLRQTPTDDVAPAGVVAA